MDYSLLDQLLTVALVVDKKANVLYFNHICSVYFQLPPRKLKKLTKIEDFLINHDQAVEKNLNQAFEQNIPIVSKEIQILMPEDESNIKTVILKMIPLDNDHVLIHLWDMSLEIDLHQKYKDQIKQLKENHEQILMADKLTALGELIAGIGHEVSNPLTIISDRLFRLNESLIKKDLKTLKTNLKDVEIEINRVSKIITNMQSFVKNQDEELEIISLRKVINDSISFINELNLIGKTKVSFNAQNDQAILGNELKIQQVVINILKNAIDAVKETKNPQITINLRSDQDEQSTIISIKDNGVGIPEDIKDKLFDMFVTSKEFGEGTGLGLSISQKIIESYFGQVYFDSKLDIGSEFFISLPFIEFSSFTKSNAYLNGIKETEDPKVILFSTNLDFLNQYFKEFEQKDVVVIVTKDKEDIDNLIDFYDAKAIFVDPNEKIKNQDHFYQLVEDLDIDQIIRGIED